MDIIPIIIAIVGSGALTALITNLLNKRYNKAKTDKTKAEAGHIIGDTYNEIIQSLRLRVDEISKESKDIKKENEEIKKQIKDIRNRYNAIMCELKKKDEVLTGLNALPCQVWTVDKSLTVQTVYGSLFETFDIDAKKYIGEPVEKFYENFEEKRARHLKCYKKAFSGETVNFIEDTFGTDIDVTLTPIKNDNGHIYMVIGLSIISQKK